LDFIYRDVAGIDTASLSQGDVIERSNEIVDILSEAHQYYADASSYTHFVVITQSCDLARRKGNFNAPYITIAAARPLKETIQKFLDGQSREIAGSDFRFHPLSSAGKTKQLLERHLHNTEPEFFFLPEAGHPNVPEDLLVFLRLTVALKKAHYDVLANSKIAELNDVFQAKLGWLKGNIYSRVATPDLEEHSANAVEEKKAFYNKYLPSDEMIWLSPIQNALLRQKVKAEKSKLKRNLTHEEVLLLIDREIPEDAQIVADSVISKLVKNKILDGTNDTLIGKARTAIANEATIKSLVNRN